MMVWTGANKSQLIGVEHEVSKRQFVIDTCWGEEGLVMVGEHAHGKLFAVTIASDVESAKQWAEDRVAGDGAIHARYRV